MSDKLIFILPAITLLIFFYNIYSRGNTVQSYLLFILTLLPFMDLKITKEAMGGFKIFDFLNFFGMVILFKEFVTVNLKGRNNFYFFLFVLFSIIVLISGLSSEFPGKTYLALIKYFPIFIFARFFITECVKDPLFVNKAIRALKIAYLIDLGFLVGQLILGLKFTFYPGLATNTIDPVVHVIRYPGVFYDSQAHGQFLALGSFLFLYMEEGSSRKAVITNYAIFGFSLAALALAGSRSAIGGFAVGLFIVLLLGSAKYRLYAAALIGISILGYVIVSPQGGIFSRTKNLSEDYSYRQSIWNDALTISRNHPYLGIGSGNYQQYIMRHVQDQYIEIEDGKLVYFDQPENGYLKILVELGYLGFGIFVLFILIPLLTGFQAFLKYPDKKPVVFFMASLVGWLVAFNTVYSIYDYRLLIMVVSMITLMITYPSKDDIDELAEN